MAYNDELIEFIKARLKAFDPKIDVTNQSSAFHRVVLPIARRVGPDPLDMDTDQFIRDRLRQEHPTLPVEPGSSVNDILINPTIPLAGAFNTALRRVRTGQSLANTTEMSDESVDLLLQNFFLQRLGGGYAVGSIRVKFSAPRFVSATAANEATSKGGLSFVPSYPQTFPAEQVASQKEGAYYYVDIMLRSSEPGEEYNVDPAQINAISGLSGVVQVTNRFKMRGGRPRETNEQARQRGERALTERSLTCYRGTFTRIMDLFGDTVRNVVVTGFGDPEMNRDLLTGSGEGHLLSSGMSLVIGNILLHCGMYEDRGREGEDRIQAGHEIDLNYWPMLYGLPSSQQHERFDIQSLIVDSRELVPALPSIIMAQVDGMPSPSGTVLPSGIPSVLPGVFSAVRSPGKIEVDNIPGGILRPITPDGTIEVSDRAVHLGGKMDVWVRPSSDVKKTIKVDEISDDEPIVAGRTLRTEGTGSTPNMVSSDDTTINWVERGVKKGDLLWIGSGADMGTYTILRVNEDDLVLEANMTVDEQDLVFKVVDEVQHDLVTPKKGKVPFGDETPGTDLQTTIGSQVVLLGTNIIELGAEEGDTLEILDGPDQGKYEIQSFDPSGGGTTPKLDKAMSASNSGVSYEVYTPQEAIQRPFVRILPSGVKMLDAENQTTGVTVPPALPVDARNPGAFSGAKHVCDGGWGFVLPDPGPLFSPEDGTSCGLPDVVGEYIEDEDMLSLLEEVVAHGCFTDGCLPCDGWIACLHLTNKRLHASFLPNSGFVTYIGQIIDWINQVYEAFFRALAPTSSLSVSSTGISFEFNEAVSEDDEVVVWQTEICLPKELFNCCCDTWVSLPEFDVDRLAQIIDDTLGEGGIENLEALFSTEAITAILGVLMGAEEPCAAQAQPGDVLMVREGPNEGGYFVKHVHSYQIKVPLTYPEGTEVSDVLEWVATVDALSLTFVTIEGEFPIETCGALCEFFSEGFPEEPNLPDIPLFEGVCYDDYYDSMDPFSWIVKFFQWLFEWLSTLGLDIPDEVNFQWGEFVKSLLETLLPSYGIDAPTCDNKMRVYWSEPTTAEFIAGGGCIVVDGEAVRHVGGSSLFSTTVGSEEVIFSPSPDAPAHMLVPSKETTEDPDDLDWPREIEFSGSSCTLTDPATPAPVALGLEAYRDVLHLHEERFLLGGTKVRRPALKTTVGSSAVTLLDSFPHDVVADELLEVGDLVFLEQGAHEGGYRITKKLNDKQFELDQPLLESSLSALRHGNDGSFDGTGSDTKRFSSASSPFTTEDIGRFLTVYGTEGSSNDVSKEITSVAPDGSYVELDDDFGPLAETDVLWCVTKAPAEGPSDTDEGGTTLVGVCPFRVYDGDASEWLITSVSTGLDVATDSFDVISYEEFEAGTTPSAVPADGKNQPFAVKRPGIQRITSTQMAENRERGLYYFDVLVRSRGGGEEYNLPRKTKFEAVMGTYRADGYRYEVENPDLTFSAYEQVRLVFSPRMLPVGSKDTEEEYVPIRGQKLQLDYEYASAVNQIQQMFLSKGDRQVTSDPLVRHFLPQYLYLTIETRGSADVAEVYSDLLKHVQGLGAQDEVIVSSFEKILSSWGMDSWTHPVELIALTHDLDRRQVVERSTDRLGGTEEVTYNGTNRISYLILGPNESDKEDEEDVPDGERVRVIQADGPTLLS